MAQIQKSSAAPENAAGQALAQIEMSQARIADSRAAVGKLADGVISAVGTTVEVIGLIDTLAESIDAIERIVEGMALLAVQTTMLAVSGSVEAARAGDQGRGFAVVSADIRNLARTSGDNAERARAIVRTMRGQVDGIRRDLEQIAAVGDAEMQKNRRLDERLSAVSLVAEDLKAGSQEVMDAARSARLMVDEVLSGVVQIATVAEQASSAAAEAGAAARQQSRGAEDLAAAIEEIASLADELRTREA